ncbi:MAG: ArsR/SmtB family transcription factor [Candidatus Izemoplasmataceae bacterium]
MDKYRRMEKILKVLADHTRLKILSRIYQGEVCGCDLIHCLDISQPTLSHHLKVLSSNGFIEGSREGNRILYKVNKASLEEVETMFEALLEEKITC